MFHDFCSRMFPVTGLALKSSSNALVRTRTVAFPRSKADTKVRIGEPGTDLCDVEHRSKLGRPAYDRDQLLLYLWRQPRRGRGLVMLNARSAGAKLGWHRTTIRRALADLERDGLLRRFPRGGRGRCGLLVVLEGVTA